MGQFMTSTLKHRDLFLRVQTVVLNPTNPPLFPRDERLNISVDNYPIDRKRSAPQL